MTTYRWMGMACAWLVACGGEAGNLDDADATTDQLGVGRQALAGGTTTFDDSVWGATDEAIGRVNGGSCTGALISPNTVLSAAHCFCAENNRGPDAVLSRCDDRASFTLDNGDRVEGGVVIHPEFGQSWWHAYDYALIRLDAPYRTVASIPFSDRRPEIGERVHLVGYGGRGTPCNIAADGHKRTTSVLVDAMKEDWDFSMTDTTRHLCPGDSGGPVLRSIDGSLRVVGVNSWTDKTDDSVSVLKPTQVVYDWLLEHLAPLDLPGDTWGHCVYYSSDSQGAYVSSRNDARFTGDSAWMNNQASQVWVRKGYKATLYDTTSYGTELASLDGYHGQACNEYGCLHTLTGGADNRAGSARCATVAPGDTWGDCVFYPRIGDGAYVSTRGTVNLAGEYAAYDNRVTNVWVKAGAQAELFSELGCTGFETTLSGTRGGICNSFGCLHNLALDLDDTGTRLAENTMSSARCSR